MEYSGFFNALESGGVYDRTYNANDYSHNLATIISNGVRRSEDDDLRVTASGMLATVAIGRAWINGHYYYNDTPLTFAAVTAPSGGTRWDRIVLRLDNSISERKVSLIYVKGTAANSPTKPAPVRSGDIYDLVLADIFVGTNATSISVTDTRANASLCGWVFSTAGDNSFFETLDRNFDEWFTDKKDSLATVTQEIEYKQTYTLPASGKFVNITIPQYVAGGNQKMAVYVNGLRKYSPDDYTVSGSVITFSGTLTAGTEVSVYLTISKDGTGIPSIVKDFTALQNEVYDLKKGVNASTYTYICNGANDNVQISTIAQEFLNGGNDYGTIRISVFGTFGASAAYAGVGNSTSPFRWFSVGADEAKNRRVIVDFSSCGEISLPIAAGTVNTVFHGLNAHIIGANVLCSQTAAGTSVRVFASTAVNVFAENCRFWITSYQDSRIANTGTFRNCRGSIANIISNTYCFQPYDTGLIRVYGGEFYAYTGASNALSAIVGQSAANAVSILYGVNAPTSARSGFYQTNSLIQYVGGGVLSCTDLVSELPMTVTAGISNIRGTIAKSKAGAM